MFTIPCPHPVNDDRRQVFSRAFVHALIAHFSKSADYPALIDRVNGVYPSGIDTTDPNQPLIFRVVRTYSIRNNDGSFTLTLNAEYPTNPFYRQMWSAYLYNAFDNIPGNPSAGQLIADAAGAFFHPDTGYIAIPAPDRQRNLDRNESLAQVIDDALADDANLRLDVELQPPYFVVIRTRISNETKYVIGPA